MLKSDPIEARLPTMEPRTRDLYLRLLRHVMPYWRVFAMGIGAMVIVAITGPAASALLTMVDDIFVDKDLLRAKQMAGLLVLLFGAAGVAAYASSVALGWVGSRVVMDLRTQMFDKLTTLPARYLDQHASGNLISKVTFDAAQVTEAATHVLTVAVRDTLTVLGLVAWMVYLDWKLALVVFLAAPIIGVVVKRLSHRLRQMSLRLQASMGDVTHVLEEAIDGQKVVRIYGGRDYERSRFESQANWARRFQFKFFAAAAANAPVAQFIAALALAAIVYLAAREAVTGQISVGEFVSFFAAMTFLFPPLKRVTNVTGPLQKGLAAAQSIFSLIDEVSEPDQGTRTIERARGHLEFRNVVFAYEDDRSPALDGISLRIEPGETVALVGPSGSGKTTLVSLVPRFYSQSSGQILLDGVDIETLTLASLRSNIALVSQDTVLFDDTVANNIAYGATASASRTAVVAAARAAQAMEFIEALPEGLGTRIGQNGVLLSGGQRQRVAIARAFLKDAPILILDEATSSLDAASEREIQEALERLREGRTTIVIAHRLSTIERANRIVVMAGGKIVESGTHSGLLEKNSLYAGLYRFQFARQHEASAAGGS